MRRRLLLHRNSIINQLLIEIKKENDFEKAVKTMIDNQLTLESLTRQTFKLTQRELARLADTIIHSRF